MIEDLTYRNDVTELRPAIATMKAEGMQVD